MESVTESPRAQGIHTQKQRRRQSRGSYGSPAINEEFSSGQASQPQEEKVLVYATMSDHDFGEQFMGECGFPPSYYTTVIAHNCEIWGMDVPSGSTAEDEKAVSSSSATPKFLLRYKTNAFTEAEQALAREVFQKHASQAQSYRRRASITKGQSMAERSTAHSMIAGSWDRRDAPTTQKLSKDVTFQRSRQPGSPLPNTICRTTAFTANNVALWQKGLPWIQSIAQQHHVLAPDAYAWQIDAASKCLPKLIIPQTPYSTLTVNYNWATNIHKDSGDMGLGNLSVTGTEGDWEGCWFCLPRYKLAIKAVPRSFMVADVHEYHCNTPLVKHSPEAVRLSFVAYLRDRMHECNTEINLESGESMFVP